MASALASPPPLLPFGASDLKRNARTFLERALVISAILHLAAVGAFRAAYERMIPKEEVVALNPKWNPPVEIGPHLIPLAPHGYAPPTTSDGFIVPVDPRRILPGQEPTSGFGFVGSGVDPVPSGDDGRTDRGRIPPPPPETSRPFKIAEIPPVPISTPLPKYPDFAREAGIEGKVIVQAIVGIDGNPREVTAISGPKILFDAAVEGVRHWKFKPGITSGQPVEVQVEIPIVFRLGN